MFGVVVDTGPKFYVVLSPPLVHYFKVRDLEFVCLSLAFHFLGPHSFQIF